MVLFKRKHVQFLPRPTIEDEDAECWIIPETQEVFLSYESYLQRMDWYKSRKFICEISGHSGLSFFDALKSEAQGARDVDTQFPDSLKEPVLRKVQFSTISRIDNLVDQVFEDFKNDFYPGETVTVLTEENTRENGVVRDKAKFPEIRNNEGIVTREAFSRYVVSLADRPSLEMLVDDHNVSRDRKVFTKQMLRSFIKNTVHREAWNGAPWLVKQQHAEWYRIDSDVPPHLQYGNKQAEKKEKKKLEQDNLFNVWQPNRLPELKPAPKGKKGQHTGEQDLSLLSNYPEEYQRLLQADPAFAQQIWNQAVQPAYNGYSSTHGHYLPPNGHASSMPPPMVPKQIPKPPPPPPPIKYPIEDMDIAPTQEKEHRPLLKSITQSQVSEHLHDLDIVPGLSGNSVGLLLEVWNTLNVYCQVLYLDSFTFDDFVDALQFRSTEIECELLVEIHCAILKKFVNSEHDQNGAIQISLPDLPESEYSDDEEEEEEEESRPPTPTPEPDVPARRTRSSLNKMQLAEEEKKQQKSPTPEMTSLHRADEMFQDNYSWIERLRKRDFRHGGWQLIVVGLLHQLAGRERVKDTCDKILTHLAPLNADPNVETVSVQYSTMDVNLRISALQIMCQLFLETKAVKTFLEEMSNTMTQFRKVKIEHQRARKEAIAKLKILHEERRQLAPQEKSPSPIPELEDTMEIDKIDNGDAEVADSDDEPVTSRSLRRGHDRAAERKRKREEEQERKQKAAEEKQNKGSKEYQKVLKAIEKEREKIEEAEEQIDIVDGDLREADCPRTRVLGKDRFCNRYWWFERNAMPYGGLPDSSTAEADYANGRLWVQGPDEMERIGYIDVPEDAKTNYFRAFQMTPAERKVVEEGSTNLNTAHDWGFYDSPEDIDALIAWLDPRGIRELKLKKELSLQKELICRYMENRKTWLAQKEPETEPTTRMSTRTKTYMSDNAPRCLKWQNTSAINQFNHRHVDPPPKPKGRTKKAETIKAKEPQAPSVFNRQGKPVTRQGSRYSF